MSDINATDSPKTKLEEQAKAKGDMSYSYWANTAKPANTDIQPVKLSESSPSTQQQADLERAGSQHTASAWNSAGTFEERDVTDWAKQKLEEMVVGTSSGSAVITKCKTITGNANIWFIRGKKRSGFDFDIELAWQLSSSAASSDGPSGTLKLPSTTPDDLDDLHIEVSLDSLSGDAAADSKALKAAKQLKQPLQGLLEKFLAELRTK